MTPEQLLDTTKDFGAGPVTLRRFFTALNGDIIELKSLGLTNKEKKMAYTAKEWGITEAEAAAAYAEAGWI